MKWIIAFVVAVAISAFIIYGFSVFGSFMDKKTEEWAEADFALGALPTFLVQLNHILRKNILVATLLSILIPFIITFTVAARKRQF